MPSQPLKSSTRQQRRAEQSDTREMPLYRMAAFFSIPFNPFDEGEYVFAGPEKSHIGKKQPKKSWLDQSPFETRNFVH
jgi:hypothetical protein